MLFVTGASGHSGKWFITKLISQKYKGKIRCSHRSTSDIGYLKKSNLDIEFVQGYLEEEKFVNRALKGVSVVVHFAGINFSKNLLRACKKNKVNWILLVHTTGRYSKFKSAAQGYIEIEDFIQSSSVNHTIVRPTMIYGSSADYNIWKLIDYIYSHKFFPVFGNGKNLMQPIHARDLGYAVYSIFRNKKVTINKAYNLAGKKAISYNELLKIVAHKLNRKIILLHIPFLISYLLARIYNFINKNAIISTEQVLRMQENKNFDYSDASRDFNFAPIGFEEGIEEEIHEFLKTQNLPNTTRIKN